MAEARGACITDIRHFRDADWPALWRVLEPVFRAGETYAIPIDIDAADARARWVEAPTATYVAFDRCGELVATYYLKPNQGGPGAHVCNCGYIVTSAARGQGIAATLCEHSQAEAARLGFRAMQYNLVVATNASALRLWQRHGFHVAGTLPGAFRHPEQGYVDAYVMFKTLV